MTVKPILDIYHNKFCERVISRVTKPLKTPDLKELRNIDKMSNAGRDAV